MRTSKMGTWATFFSTVVEFAKSVVPSMFQEVSSSIMCAIDIIQTRWSMYPVLCIPETFKATIAEHFVLVHPGENFGGTPYKALMGNRTYAWKMICS